MARIEKHLTMAEQFGFNSDPRMKYKTIMRLVKQIDPKAEPYDFGDEDDGGNIAIPFSDNSVWYVPHTDPLTVH